jgi:outer membrane protein assembly factor BamB
MHYSPAAVWPVAAKGKVFIADPQRALTAIRAADGHTVWRTFASQVRESIGLSADGLRLYGKTMNDSIVCYSTEGDAPRQLWATNVGFGYEHAPSMPLECDGVLFGSTVTGLIFALDAPTGRLLWKHRVGNSMVNTLLPLNRREVLYTTTAGDLGRLRAK